MLSGMAMLVAGVAMILFRKQLARSSVEYQNKNFGFHFKEKEIKGSSLACIIVGGVTVVTGILTLMG